MRARQPGRGLRLVRDVPDGSSPQGEPPSTAVSDEARERLYESMHRQRASAALATTLLSLMNHGFHPTAARAFPGVLVIRLEDVEPVSPVTPGTGVHAPSSPSAAPGSPSRAGGGDEGS